MSGESAVYDGGKLLGRIVEGAGESRAYLADGKKLGSYKSGREAMRAIVAAASAGRRAAQLAETPVVDELPGDLARRTLPLRGRTRRAPPRDALAEAQNGGGDP